MAKMELQDISRENKNTYKKCMDKEDMVYMSLLTDSQKLEETWDKFMALL